MDGDMVPVCSRHLAVVLDYSSISKVPSSLTRAGWGVTQVNADYGPAVQSKYAVMERVDYRSTTCQPVSRLGAAMRAVRLDGI
jgi:hypothetical protein